MVMNAVCEQACVTIPTSYADVSTFKFNRVFQDAPEDTVLFDSVCDLIDPTELGRAVSVVVRALFCACADSVRAGSHSLSALDCAAALPFRRLTDNEDCISLSRS